MNLVTELNILVYLKLNGPSKAKDIAKSFGVDKKEVNSFLYSTIDSGMFYIDKNYYWHICDEIEEDAETDSSIISKFNGYECAEKFSLKEFEEMFHLGTSAGVNSDSYYWYAGDRLEVGSSYEIEMLNYLDKNKLAQKCRTQCVSLEYTMPGKSRIRNYIPDIVFITQDGYIAFIEIKPKVQMVFDEVYVKYQALQEYCEENGFLYAMIDPSNDFFFFDDYNDVEMFVLIKDFIDDWFEEEYFELPWDECLKFYEENKAVLSITLEEFKEQVAIYIAWSIDEVGVTKKFFGNDTVIYLR